MRTGNVGRGTCELRMRGLWDLGCENIETWDLWLDGTWGL